MFKKTVFAGLMASAVFASAATAESNIEIHDAYARASGMSAVAGAAFMMIHNAGDQDDQLIDARSDVSARVELHTHIMEDGIAKMRRVEGGFTIPAGGGHILERGADHVMFMGLTQPFEQGAEIPVTLVFEHAGEIEIMIPVDLERTAGEMNHDHDHDHGDAGSMNH
ncbi:copper-binding protein [Marivivens niveibacter]|uniref:Copper-binding protein n=1 Tax=Marivivens niveibacter TaxID=1930667 RepID=A0A251WXT1_9RHOB|nr:copper chaperone PCu(A)C [Marivivens niveibacter]OUD09247.1 copper-binding protein [Marivivens niveibacter]